MADTDNCSRTDVAIGSGRRALDELRARFLDRANVDRERLRALLVSDEKCDRRDASALAHRLVGAGGTFGFAAIGRAAARLEKAIDTRGDERARAFEDLSLAIDEATSQQAHAHVERRARPTAPAQSRD